MTLPSRLGRRVAVFRGTATESVGSRNSSAAMERSCLSGGDFNSALASSLSSPAARRQRLGSNYTHARAKCSARGGGSGTEDAVQRSRLDVLLEPGTPEATPRLGEEDLAHLGRPWPGEAPEDVENLRRPPGGWRAVFREHDILEGSHESQGAGSIARLDGSLDPLVEALGVARVIARLAPVGCVEGLELPHVLEPEGRRRTGRIDGPVRARARVVDGDLERVHGDEVGLAVLVDDPPVGEDGHGPAGKHIAYGQTLGHHQGAAGRRIDVSLDEQHAGRLTNGQRRAQAGRGRGTYGLLVYGRLSPAARDAVQAAHEEWRDERARPLIAVIDNQEGLPITKDRVAGDRDPRVGYRLCRHAGPAGPQRLSKRLPGRRRRAEERGYHRPQPREGVSPHGIRTALMTNRDIFVNVQPGITAEKRPAVPPATRNFRFAGSRNFGMSVSSVSGCGNLAST